MFNIIYYTLDEQRNPVPMEPPYITEGESSEEFCDYILNISKLFSGSDKEKRIVGKTQVSAFNVSTVFLVIDHSFGLSEDPILFETLISIEDGKIDCKCINQVSTVIEGEKRRYRTWDEARAGHDGIVEIISSITGEESYELFFPEHIWQDLE